MKKNLFTHSDFLNFSVDHIEMHGTFKNSQELFRGMDSDNSHMREYEGYTLEKSERIRNYQYKITFWRDNTPCFAWYKGDQLSDFMETRDYFVVYGSSFRIHEFNEIIDFIDAHLGLEYVDMKNHKRTHTVKRIDLALDVTKNITEVIACFKDLKQKGSKFFDESGNVQTYYIGEKKNTLNKSLLIRIYDKIADIYQKEKQRYFPAYLTEKSVTRIELEFRSDLLKDVKLSQFLDKSFSFGLFCLYIKKHTSIFEKFENEDAEKLSRVNKKIEVKNLHSSQSVRKRYKNTFFGYANKFKRLDGCPIDVLIREGIYHEDTIRDIVLASEEGVFDIERYRNGLTIRNTERVFGDNFKTEDEFRES